MTRPQDPQDKYDPRSRYRNCMGCGKQTSSEISLCSKCNNARIPIDPWQHLVNVLKPSHPIPQPPLPEGFVPACNAIEGFGEVRYGDDFFFGNDTAKMEAARHICAPCPLRDWCEEFASANNEKGIWGGTTAISRTRKKQQRKAAA